MVSATPQSLNFRTIIFSICLVSLRSLLATILFFTIVTHVYVSLNTGVSMEPVTRCQLGHLPQMAEMAKAGLTKTNIQELLLVPCVGAVAQKFGPSSAGFSRLISKALI